MDQLKKFFIFLFTEIRQGNVLVIALSIAFYFYIALPLYKDFLAWRAETQLNRQIGSEIGMNQSELWERLEKLEKKSNQDFAARKPGKMGYTSF